MVDEILTGAGLVLNTTYKETRFLKPPKTTYAIYNDTVTRRGADLLNCITEHEVNVELYEYKPDPDMEAAIEAELDSRAIPYIKQQRYWIDSEQLYQIIYEFNYIEKEDVNNG